MPAVESLRARGLLAAVLARFARLLRRIRRLDLLLWTRPAGTPFYFAVEAMYAKTLDDLERCRRVLRRRYGVMTARDLRRTLNPKPRRS